MQRRPPEQLLRLPERPLPELSQQLDLGILAPRQRRAPELRMWSFRLTRLIVSAILDAPLNPNHNASGARILGFSYWGRRQDSVLISLIRPNERIPLRVVSKVKRTFVNSGSNFRSGDPFILQSYGSNQRFPTGLYTIQLTLGSNRYNVSWNVSSRDQYRIWVICR